MAARQKKYAMENRMETFKIIILNNYPKEGLTDSV